MEVIKRNKTIAKFEPSKIEVAILKAMKYGSGIVNLELAKKISENFSSEKELVDICDIESYVYSSLVENGDALTAKCYEAFRAVREYQRKKNTIDNKVLGLIRGDNIETLSENSNKQENLVSTQRDLVAEEVSKDIAIRTMLPSRIVQAHEDGLIHIHDLGHYLNPSFNCCLVNLKDMLENGTIINGKMIESPNSFRTACTIATQIVAQVASSQFGGQTISLAHLSPFVRRSKERIINDLHKEWGLLGCKVNKENEDKIVGMRLLKEIKDGIQTIQYQINTLQTSNGQSPFLSMFMYISEYPEYEVETAMLIEEVLKQRIQGIKNEAGIWITPAFPKLLYVTDENNIYKDSKYFYITKLASECVSKRMMPDFLSAKILKKNYEGNVVPPMG